MSVILLAVKKQWFILSSPKTDCEDLLWPEEKFSWESCRQKPPKLATLIVIPSASYRLNLLLVCIQGNKYIIWQVTPTNYPLSLSLKAVSGSVFGPVSVLAVSHCHGVCVNLSGAGRCRVLVTVLARTQSEVTLGRNNNGFVFWGADFGFKCFTFPTFIQGPAAQLSLTFQDRTSARRCIQV